MALFRRSISRTFSLSLETFGLLDDLLETNMRRTRHKTEPGGLRISLSATRTAVVVGRGGNSVVGCTNFTAFRLARGAEKTLHIGSLFVTARGRWSYSGRFHHFLLLLDTNVSGKVTSAKNSGWNCRWRGRSFDKTTFRAKMSFWYRSKNTLTLCFLYCLCPIALRYSSSNPSWILA